MPQPQPQPPKRWRPKYDAPADWPTLADYERLRRERMAALPAKQAPK